MRFEDFYMTEKWVKSKDVRGKYSGGVTEVFKNPTTRELSDIVHGLSYPSIRMFADNKANIYAWRGDVFHQDFFKAFPEFVKIGVYTFYWEPRGGMPGNIHHDAVDKGFEHMGGQNVSDELAGKIVENMKKIFKLEDKDIKITWDDDDFDDEIAF